MGKYQDKEQGGQSRDLDQNKIKDKSDRQDSEKNKDKNSSQKSNNPSNR